MKDQKGFDPTKTLISPSSLKNVDGAKEQGPECYQNKPRGKDRIESSTWGKMRGGAYQAFFCQIEFGLVCYV